MAKKNTNITIQEFRKWSPAKQKSWLGNVSKRVKLPDAALPADLRAKRKAGQQARAEISPGSGVTFGDVARQQKYTEGLTFGDGDRQLKERAANAAMGRTASDDWFKTYQQQVTAASGRAGAAVTAAGENNRGLLESMNRLSREDTERVQAAVRARAAQLGQAAPDAGGLEGSQGAAAARASMLASAGIMGNQAAAGNAQFAASADTAAGLARNNNTVEWNNRDRAIAGDKSAYADKKGLWRQKFLDDSINAARKSVLEDKAFGLESESKATAAELAQAKLNEAKRAARAREAISQQNANTSTYNSQKDPKPKAKVDKSQNAYKASIARLYESPVGVAGLIKNSQQGKPRGATDLINRLVGLGKGSVSYRVAQRAVYTWIATNGNPRSSNVHTAPKTWEQAIARWKKTQGK